MTPREWLALLFAEAPPGSWLTISTKKDSGSRSSVGDPFLTHWFPVSALDAAGVYAHEASKTANVYYGMGLRRQQLGPDSRGSASDVCAITCLWADIDVAGGTHTAGRRTYFPDQMTALRFLQTLPLPPSAVINSGGGLHPYWILREPLLIEEETDALLAAGLVRGWQAYLRTRTNYEIDFTHDLARVLRPPGTWNRKNGQATPVEVLTSNETRYNPDDFADWLELEKENGVATLQVPRGLTALAHAAPPPNKFLALMQNDNRFKAHWEERPVNPRDNSSSAHALGLATIAGRAGWTDQEITDLLVAFMAQSKTTHKKARPIGWYAITIAKARHGHEEAAGRAQMLQRATEATEPEERTAALSALLGFRIVQVIRRFHRDEETGMTMDPWYILETEDSRVLIEGAEVLASLPRFRAKILGHVGRYITVSQKDWPRVVEALAQAAVTDDAPPEANPCEDIRQAVREYLERRTVSRDPISAHDLNHVYESEDGVWWFSVSRWAEWARMKRGMDVGNRNITRQLELAGCRRKVFQNLPRPGGKTTKLTFWTLAGVPMKLVKNGA